METKTKSQVAGSQYLREFSKNDIDNKKSIFFGGLGRFSSASGKTFFGISVMVDMALNQSGISVGILRADGMGVCNSYIHESLIEILDREVLNRKGLTYTHIPKSNSIKLSNGSIIDYDAVVYCGESKYIGLFIDEAFSLTDVKYKKFLADLAPSGRLCMAGNYVPSWYLLLCEQNKQVDTVCTVFSNIFENPYIGEQYRTALIKHDFFGKKG